MFKLERKGRKMIAFHTIEEAAEHDITPGMPVKGIPFLHANRRCFVVIRKEC
jgi:hypothetical protein